jgi:hypothetical protein
MSFATQVFDNVVVAMQDAEQMGNHETGDYVTLMDRIIAEATERKQTAIANKRADDLAAQDAMVHSETLEQIRRQPRVAAAFFAYIGRMSIYPNVVLEPAKLDDLRDAMFDGTSLREAVVMLGLPGSQADDDF